ncbi:hypothetical protein LY78DRAFT_659088 [Colletotrichum sublineola]|nr:hypothetical protein LY78DRAFT_659088 [Colletotrichum sublineola]
MPPLLHPLVVEYQSPPFRKNTYLSKQLPYCYTSVSPLWLRILAGCCVLMSSSVAFHLKYSLNYLTY